MPGQEKKNRNIRLSSTMAAMQERKKTKKKETRVAQKRKKSSTQPSSLSVWRSGRTRSGRDFIHRAGEREKERK